MCCAANVVVVTGADEVAGRGMQYPLWLTTIIAKFNSFSLGTPITLGKLSALLTSCVMGSIACSSADISALEEVRLVNYLDLLYILSRLVMCCRSSKPATIAAASTTPRRILLHSMRCVCMATNIGQNGFSDF